MARIMFCHWFWITLVSGDTRVFPSSFTLVRVSAGLLLSAAAEEESEVDCLDIFSSKIFYIQKVAMIHCLVFLSYLLCQLNKKRQDDKLHCFI